MVLNKLKLLRTRLAAAAVLAIAPFVAMSGVSSASGSISWTGQGADSVKACASGQMPYLHWIFTTGGNSSVTSATLTVSGSASGGGAMSQHGGSWTIDTSYSGAGQPTTSSLSASVTYTGSLGNGHANLVISDGCYASSGGQGGGGNTNTGGQGQVLGSSTNQSTPTAQVQTPQGGVGAGFGGASTVRNTAAVLGLGGSLLSLGSGVAWLNRRKV